ncbi:MAG: VOC family protein [Salinisphaera sp.]|nr:VOC family protein [Salinisphaera sp.]
MTTDTRTSLRIGRVTLNVRDVARVADFYHTTVGLEVLAADHASATLGAGSTALLELRGDPTLPSRSPRNAGLFHTAFLLPTRADLGRWIAHARRRNLQLDGAADHLVSEAVYLSDPEGNGIEIYADRPCSQWRYANGRVEMANNVLDFEGLHIAAGTDTWQGFPKHATLGHVHLQVGAIEPAEAFYRALLGFELTCRYPGASFFATGGYHHQIAANIWNSAGAGTRHEPTAGLANVEIVASHQGVIDAIRERLDTTRSNKGWSLSEPSLSLDDPWGTHLSLTIGH